MKLTIINDCKKNYQYQAYHGEEMSFGKKNSDCGLVPEKNKIK